MPRVIERVVFKFEELDDRAKEKARDWYRQFAFSDSSDWEFVYQDAEEVANILGIDIDQRRWTNTHGHSGSEPCIYFSGFSSQGDGACFEGSYSYSKGAAKKIREKRPDDKDLRSIADALQKVQAKHFYKLRATMTHRGHYSHSGCMDVDVSHCDDQYRDIGDSEDEVRDQVRLFADWIYDQLEKEYEYHTSDEVVEEIIVANGYEFNEDGSVA